MVAENHIDQSNILKNQITFNKNEKESRGDNKPRKKPKTNWEDKTYAQLIAGITN